MRDLPFPDPVPALVTMHVWRVAAGSVPAAVARMATHRRPLRRTGGLRFAKLLGTGRAFTLRDADPCQWGLLATWRSRRDADDFEGSAVLRSWRRIATEEWRLGLTPLSARGRWSRRAPFGTPKPAHWRGRVAALTRARIAPAKAVRFWRAVPAVAADLAGRPGLLAAVGVGEAPIGVQGTFSVWRNAEDLTAFAYRDTPHQTAIARTSTEGWYAEELFARFGVLDSVGTFRGSDPVT